MFKERVKEYVIKYYKIIIGVAGGLSISLLLIYGYYNNRTLPKTANKDVVDDNILLSPVESDGGVKVEDNYYYVDIKGAVKTPNVYKVSTTLRVIDVINLAGGLTDQSDTSSLNLSKMVNDEMLIIIYTKDEISKFKESGVTTTEVIKYIEKECNCPDPVINEACPDANTSESSDNRSKILINTANKDELMTLPGIGEAKANDIIDYRNNNGLFKNIDDLKNVTGVGDSIFDKIKDLITI